jgi:hypothetical protein
MFIAKIMLYLNLASALLGILLGLGIGKWTIIASNAFEAAIAGFMIYLIGYIGE